MLGEGGSRLIKITETLDVDDLLVEVKCMGLYYFRHLTSELDPRSR